MRRIWAAALSAILLLSACAQQESPSPPLAETPAEGQTLRLAAAVQNEKDGVTLRAEKLEDGMLTIRLINHSGALWYYGEGFGLFRRNAQEGWDSVPDERRWIMIAHELEDGDEVTLLLDLTPLPLESGTYKLVKDGLELSFRLTGLKNA